jgi:hypothetical protein
VGLGVVAGCQHPAVSDHDAGDEGGGEPKVAASAPVVDTELESCAARWKAIEAEAAEPGAPGFDRARIALLGRARGPSLLFARTPEPAKELPAVATQVVSRLAKSQPGIRVAKLRGELKRDPAAFRAALLREGYAYAEDPEDAYEMVQNVSLTDLFADDEIFLERGTTREKLVRAKLYKEWRYEYAEGDKKGRPAHLVFGDRVAATEAGLGEPLHVDVGAFADEAGFDRLTPIRMTASSILAEVRVAPAGKTARAVIEREGASLRMGCFVEPLETREAIAKAIGDDAWRRRAIASMRRAIDETTNDALPFDRPRDFEGPDRDGELRPHWASAYYGGRQGFEVDGEQYPVFLPDGRAFPPTVCVDFVLDTWERASGNWYRPRGDKPGRTAGRLDFDAEKIENRRGVLGFGAFAAERKDLFDTRQFTGAERVPFAERERFFAGLVKDAKTSDPFRPGDVVAIQGLKRDDRVHQHAILIESVDPVTGLPSGLADQMKRPRRRTWEGIMREAPKRSLLYRARPTRALFERLAAE